MNLHSQQNAVLLKGYGVFRFVFLYTLPVFTFVTCYWRILMVIRSQNKVTAGSHAVRSTRAQAVETVSPSTNVNRTRTTISNVKTGQSKGVEHCSRYKLIEISL